MTVCAEGSLFLGSRSNLTSTFFFFFHSCAHFIDWAFGRVGSLFGKAEEKEVTARRVRWLHIIEEVTTI